MDQYHTYQIAVQGQMGENDLNATSPVPMVIIQTNPTSMHFTIHADQSGLIGLIRHLHSLGLALLSVNRTTGLAVLCPSSRAQEQGSPAVSETLLRG